MEKPEDQDLDSEEDMREFADLCVALRVVPEGTAIRRGHKNVAIRLDRCYKTRMGKLRGFLEQRYGKDRSTEKDVRYVFMLLYLSNGTGGFAREFEKVGLMRKKRWRRNTYLARPELLVALHEVAKSNQMSAMKVIELALSYLGGSGCSSGAEALEFVQHLKDTIRD